MTEEIWTESPSAEYKFFLYGCDCGERYFKSESDRQIEIDRFIAENICDDEHVAEDFILGEITVTHRSKWKTFDAEGFELDAFDRRVIDGEPSDPAYNKAVICAV